MSIAGRLRTGGLSLFLIVGAAFLGLNGGTASGQEVSWVPVGADGPFIFGPGVDGAGQPTEIILQQGVAYNRIELEIRLNGWADAAGAPELGTTVSVLDHSGLLGANAAPPNPGVDLVPLSGPHGLFDSVFQNLKQCTDFFNNNTGQRCDTLVPPLPPCPAGTFCGDNYDFVFAGILNNCAVATSTPNYFWGAVSNAGQCKADDGVSSYYAGTLVVTEPTGAADGTYTISFAVEPPPGEPPGAYITELKDCDYEEIPDIMLTSGQVTFGVGCCLPDHSCELLTEEDCQLAGGSAGDSPCTDDADGDGVADGCDGCPNNPDLITPGACGCDTTDSDGDGVADGCDGCPNNPGLIAPGACGCDTTDSDGDGTLNCLDACPNDPLKSQSAGVCGCGVPDVDSDGDGVLNCNDRCPGFDDAVVGDECPQPTPAVGAWGMAVLTLLLLLAMAAKLRRRRTA